MQAGIGYIYLLAIPDAAFHESTNRMYAFNRPDAYIFTKEAVKESGLRVVRTYRLVNPAIDDPTEPRAASPPLPAG